MNKLINLRSPCPGTSPAPLDDDMYPYGAANIKRYNEGTSPLGCPEWPYNKFEVSLDTVSKIFQGQLNGIAKEFMPPEPEPDTWSEIDNTSVHSDSSVDERSSLGDSGSE